MAEYWPSFAYAMMKMANSRRHRDMMPAAGLVIMITSAAGGRCDSGLLTLLPNIYRDDVCIIEAMLADFYAAFPTYDGLSLAHRHC